MSEPVKPTIAALRAWLKTCPLIAEEQEATGAAFRIAGLEEESTAFSIEDSPGDPIITEYISGWEMAKNYLFLSRREYSEVDAVSIQNSGFFGNVAGTDVLGILGGGVQGAGMLLHMVGADDPLAFLGLGALDLERQHKIVRRLNAGIRRAGRDAGLGNGFGYGHIKTPFILACSRSGAFAAASYSCPRCL